MKFLRTLAHALGPKRFMVGALITAALGIANKAIPFADGRTFSEFLGLHPLWVPVIVLILFVGWHLLTHARQLEDKAEPRIQVGIATKPVRVRSGLGEKLTIRGTVTGISGQNSCRAFIAEVQRWNASKTSYVKMPMPSRVPLPWVDSRSEYARGGVAIESPTVLVGPHEHFAFEILEAHSMGHGLRVSGHTVESADWVQRLFTTNGQYELKVCVVYGDQTISKVVAVTIEDDWDKIKIEVK